MSSISDDEPNTLGDPKNEMKKLKSGSFSIQIEPGKVVEVYDAVKAFLMAVDERVCKDNEPPTGKGL